MTNVKNRRVGLIIGKFLPLHNGHLYFINEVSKELDVLIVLVDEDKITHPEICKNANIKYPNLEIRTNWLKKLFKNNNKIKVLSMNEDGIPSYPNGWLPWSKKVKSIVGKEVTHIFTSDIKYKDEYKKYFPEYIAIFWDNDRKATNGISSTKVRSNLIKYKNNIPNVVQCFFNIN